MRLIDADQMAADESEAYMNVYIRPDIKKIDKDINYVVHTKIQKLIADTPTAVPMRHGHWREHFSEDRYSCSDATPETRARHHTAHGAVQRWMMRRCRNEVGQSHNERQKPGILLQLVSQRKLVY